MTLPRALALLGLAMALSACGGSEPAPEARAALAGQPLAAFRTSALTAGPTDSSSGPANPYADDADALTQGRQLFTSFNCSGCHGGAGGGGIGPPLADGDWIYGGSDAQIYASIVQGRPNGMPAFGPMISGEAVWKLAAYVRSLHQDVQTGVSRRD